MRLGKRFRVIKTFRSAPTWTEKYFWAITGLTLFYLLLVILFQGYRLSLFGFESVLVRFVELLVSLGIITEALINQVLFPLPEGTKRRRWIALTLALLILLAAIFHRFVLPFILIYQIVVVGNRLSRAGVTAGLINSLRQRSFYSLLLSFAGLIALGTFFLTLPAATTDGRGASFIDSLFTATSATCVTGLIVRDTGSYFSRFGQIIILALIQLGGLGIMTFSTSMAVLLGHRLALGERRLVAEMIETPRETDIVRAIRYILLFTLLAEGTGCLLLFLRWLPVFPNTAGAFYYALFHAVSAFCNAGFSLFADSLIRYQGDLMVNFVFIGLIVSGGLGFAVVHELISRDTLRQPWRQTVRHISVHSRLALTTTFLLIVIGTVVFFFIEYDRTLTNLPVGTKLLASLFQSVTARTAGFNTIPIGSLHQATMLVIIILMFIGASPGGTGGGIKTTTFAILLLALRAWLSNRKAIIIGRRTIPQDAVFRAIVITVAATVAIVIILFLLLITESGRFQELLFETVSAFGTVGLSTGITSGLKTLARLGIILLMFTGRVGPLTIALAMTRRETKYPITYPQARIMVG